MSEASPFVVGKKVGVTDPHARGGIREDEVAKVHKTGNFVLVGEPGKQWRPYQASRWTFGGEGRVWVACPTGPAYSHRECSAWNDQIAARRDTQADADDRKRRWMNAQDALGKLRHETPPASFLDKIEVALAEIEAPETSDPALPLSLTGRG